MIPLIRILWGLAPIARDIAKAAKKSSPGGKRITKAEWEAILLRRKDDAWRELDERINR